MYTKGLEAFASRWFKVRATVRVPHHGRMSSVLRLSNDREDNLSNEHTIGVKVRNEDEKRIESQNKHDFAFLLGRSCRICPCTLDLHLVT